MTADYND